MNEAIRRQTLRNITRNITARDIGDSNRIVIYCEDVPAGHRCFEQYRRMSNGRWNMERSPQSWHIGRKRYDVPRYTQGFDDVMLRDRCRIFNARLVHVFDKLPVVGCDHPENLPDQATWYTPHGNVLRSAVPAWDRNSHTLVLPSKDIINVTAAELHARANLRNWMWFI